MKTIKGWQASGPDFQVVTDAEAEAISEYYIEDYFGQLFQSRGGSLPYSFKQERARLTSFRKLLGDSIKEKRGITCAKGRPLSSNASATLFSNADWLRIYEKGSIEGVNHHRIKRSLLEGVDDSIRGKIWFSICGISRMKEAHSRSFFQHLVSQDIDERVILKDIHRTPIGQADK